MVREVEVSWNIYFEVLFYKFNFNRRVYFLSFIKTRRRVGCIRFGGVFRELRFYVFFY